MKIVKIYVDRSAICLTQDKINANFKLRKSQRRNLLTTPKLEH